MGLTVLTIFNYLFAVSLQKSPMMLSSPVKNQTNGRFWWWISSV